MNRGQLVELVANSTGFTKSDVEKTITTTIDAIKAGVKKDGAVKLLGFGTFSKVKRQARNGVNPATGAKIKIKAKTVAKFSASKIWDVNKAPALKAAKKAKK